jgi:hypothetical protein
MAIRANSGEVFQSRPCAWFELSNRYLVMSLDEADAEFSIRPFEIKIAD